VFDVASAIGVEVRFLDLPSLEGMFCREPGPRILLPCFNHRPRGRVAFSCAHEIGHLQLGHQTSVDVEGETNAKANEDRTDEFAANCFAASLLMPRQAVLAAFTRRDLTPSQVSPFECFLVACELGVGYETLINHLCFALDVISTDVQKSLKKTAPKEIKAEFIGEHQVRDLVILDGKGPGAVVDIQVGDGLALLRATELDGGALMHIGTQGEWTILRAEKPSIINLKLGAHSLVVRVARFGYVGPWKNRYLADPDV